MNCPNCDKKIFGITGLQELQKFQKHLIKCKKYPDRVTVPNNDPYAKKGSVVNLTYVSMMKALNIRAESGQ